ncbi:hypothetical protein KAW08_03195 [bacterium]|nr:hypothetical protein [bacterium]
METLEARVPGDLYSEIKERVRLKLYSNESQVVVKGLKKVFAEESREYLRSLVKGLGVDEGEMLNEAKRIRG